MRTRILVAALVLAGVLPAVAEPPTWKFKPGQTMTYECRSTFHFSTFQLVKSEPPKDAPPESDTVGYANWLDRQYREAIRKRLEVETDPGRRAAMQALLDSNVLITSREFRAAGLDPQWETVTLIAFVKAVGDDGSARLEFTVDGVRIETRFDDTGAQSVWDSKDKTAARFEGHRAYQAMVGHRFEAIVAADGSIREVAGEAWPAPAGLIPEVGRKERREASAANATHAPTPARVWMEMLFTITPTGGDQWERTVRMPEAEVLSLRADSPEVAGGQKCVRAKARSRDREHAMDGAKLAFQMKDGDLAMRMCVEAQKLGHSWFSPVLGCLVKSEMKSSSEVKGDRLIVGDFVLEVELKNRGVRDLTPATEESAPPSPTK